MAGGGNMGAMPQGGEPQGSIAGMQVGPGMGNQMGGQPGMMGGMGMGGMGFGGGQPGMGAPQGMGMPQGDTFQPQNPSQGLSMAQIGQMLRGLQGGQMQQMPQAAPQYSASPSMQQPLPQQMQQMPQQPASQIAQGAYREFLGKPAAPQSVAQPQQGIAGLQNRDQAAKSALNGYLAMRNRRR